MADILLAAELENEMAEMAEGEGDEQDFEDEMADVCFCFLFCYCNLCYVIVEHLKMTKKKQLPGHVGCVQEKPSGWETKEKERTEGCFLFVYIVSWFAWSEWLYFSQMTQNGLNYNCMYFSDAIVIVVLVDYFYNVSEN